MQRGEKGMAADISREEIYMHWLYSEAGFTAARIEELIRKRGSAESIYRSDAGELGFRAGVQADEVLRLRFDENKKKTDPEKAFSLLEKKGIKMCWKGHPDYPRRLADIPSPPRILYIMGKMPQTGVKAVAIVGARTCSQYGRVIAEEFGRQFAGAGIAVISGMARGIDSIGQMSALRGGGCSVGVLGCGADVCYPPENRELYGMLIRNGAVISEYPVGTEPLGCYFPARNRIISGLADAVVVVEAREKSGTMITVDCALEQGRDVYAVPGRITDCLSGGCNRLIKQGADPVLTAQELIDEICGGKNVEHEDYPGADKMIKTPSGLDEGERIIWNILDYKPMSIEEIRQRVSPKLIATIPQLMQILLQMCFKGAARQVSGSYYSRS